MYKNLPSAGRKGPATAFLLIAILPAIMIACSSQKFSQKETAVQRATAADTLCQQVIRYHIEKSYSTNENGEEKEDNTALLLTLAPGEGLLQMKIRDNANDGGKAPLKLLSCTLTPGMKSGEALYETTEEKRMPDGSKTATTIAIKVQANNGTVSFSLSSPQKPGGLKMTAARWEMLKELDKETTVANKPQAPDGGWSIDASRKIFSIDSIVKKGYTLLFYVLSPGFDSTVKRRMTDAFFTVYPKQAAQYNPEAPKKVIFMVDPTYQGVAAALGNVVRYSPEWFAQNPEDIDVVTHEVMHVVQGYNYVTVPFWVTEGIADYVRSVYGLNNEKAKWELQKPVAQSHYGNGYKITARFFFWLEEQYKLEFVTELNSVAAAKAYTDNFWQAKFGKTVDELWEEYRGANNVEDQPAPVQIVRMIGRNQALDSLLNVYAARDAEVKSKFEVSNQLVFGPNVALPPGYPEESSDYLYWYNHPVFAGRRHTLINRTIESALKFAYGDSKMPVVYDSARLFPAIDRSVFKKWYCFDIIEPKEKEDSLEDILLTKIQDHFKLSTRIDSLDHTVLALQKIEGFVFKAIEKKAGENTREASYELFKHGIMEPYILIKNFLEAYTAFPVLDETGLEKAYDLGFRSGVDDRMLLAGAESKDVGERLRQHGLKLVKVVRKYPTLIISRK